MGENGREWKSLVTAGGVLRMGGSGLE
jgi:hypothetical protein